MSLFCPYTWSFCWIWNSILESVQNTTLFSSSVQFCCWQVGCHWLLVLCISSLFPSENLQDLTLSLVFWNMTHFCHMCQSAVSFHPFLWSWPVFSVWTGLTQLSEKVISHGSSRAGISLCLHISLLNLSILLPFTYLSHWCISLMVPPKTCWMFSSTTVLGDQIVSLLQNLSYSSRQNLIWEKVGEVFSVLIAEFIPSVRNKAFPG